MDKEIGYIGHEELVFNPENGIQSGGFSVSSILMKSGMSPIVTMNVNTGQNGGSNQVSDLFQNLAVPNWATMYNMKGGEYKEQENKNHVKDDSDSDIDDDLHDKLLDLVKEHENKVNKNNKSKKINKREKKNTTRRKNIKKKKEELNKKKEDKE
jgi:hypothetical protein